MTNMRPSLALPIAALMAIGSATPALADFQLHRDNGAAPSAASSAPADTSSGEPARPVSRFKVAQGFGNDVPMSFATRQIVPASVSVRFGKGVDPAAAVSWRGGAPWNRVLAAAVRPLGLQIFTGATTVLISR